ncbi:MAG: hypothetical protein Q4B06_04350 [Candidatus Saccharibacteria bacterium]|nr:hypothetical protein [Candidatus Saccharibacteria bacterium]
MEHLKSNILTPFVDSLNATTTHYQHGDPKELYKFRGRLIMFATTALWHHPAKKAVEFDTNFGEYLALLQDNPPMTEWIDEYRTKVIPAMLKSLRTLLEEDTSPLPKQSIQDISKSATHIATHCLPHAITPAMQQELHEAYLPTQEFFATYQDYLSDEAQKAIAKIDQQQTLHHPPHFRV